MARWWYLREKRSMPSEAFHQRLIQISTESTGAEELRASSPPLRVQGIEISDLDTRNYTFCPLPARIEPDTTIGEYSIIEAIHTGGMSTVFRASQASRGNRDVALKVLSPHLVDAPGAARCFHREAELSARVAHPGIVPTYASGVDGAYHFYAMKWMRCPTLADFIDGADGRRSDLFYRDVAVLFAYLSRTVANLHSSGVLHRDIKPVNLFLRSDLRILLADFSVSIDLADPSDDEEFDDEHGTRTLLGTPAYMSPERFLRKEAALDPRSDIYAIGLTLYETVTGLQPFLKQSDDDVARLKLTRKPPAPRQIRHDVPLGLEAIIRQAIQTDVDLRHRSADDLARDLERFASSRRIQTRSHPSPGFAPEQLIGDDDGEDDIDENGGGSETDGQPAVLR